MDAKAESCDDPCPPSALPQLDVPTTPDALLTAPLLHHVHVQPPPRPPAAPPPSRLAKSAAKGRPAQTSPAVGMAPCALPQAHPAVAAPIALLASSVVAQVASPIQTFAATPAPGSPVRQGLFAAQVAVARQAANAAKMHPIHAATWASYVA